jgi:hypothetical protein
MVPAPVIALYAASVLATGTAATLAVREPRHRPLAALFAWGLAADVVTLALRPAEGWAHPLEGAARLGFHVAQAALGGYPLGVAASAAVVLGGAPPRRAGTLLGVAWGLLVIGLVVSYGPFALWDGRLERVYGVIQGLVVAALVVTAVRWRRARGAEPRSVAELVVWAAGAVEVLNLAGPYLLGFSWWPRMARTAYGALYFFSVVMQGGALWKSRSRWSS